MKTPEAFFLTVDGPASGQRFCLFHPAQGDVLRGRVVYIHPFAEEMNKSRRMAAMQSRALAAAGFAVLQIDLHGCGDSSGDFGDASWQAWIDDVLRACDWLGQRSSELASAPLWLWGLRAGCLLAAAAAPHLTEPCHFCLWQPTVAGKMVLQQFLRLKLAADLLAGDNKGKMEALRAKLAQDCVIEVAGYSLSLALATGLEQAKLMPPQSGKGRLEWFDITARDDAPLTPVAADALERWGETGFQIRRHIVTGPQFWQTTEIEQSMSLLAQTSAALLEVGVLA